jgi:hypothetical protein
VRVPAIYRSLGQAGNSRRIVVSGGERALNVNEISGHLREWYRGKFIPPPPNDPQSMVVFISPGHYEQPPLAKFLGTVGRFWSNHWKWIITTFIAVAAGIWLKGK